MLFLVHVEGPQKYYYFVLQLDVSNKILANKVASWAKSAGSNIFRYIIKVPKSSNL